MPGSLGQARIGRAQPSRSTTSDASSLWLRTTARMDRPLDPVSMLKPLASVENRTNSGEYRSQAAGDDVQTAQVGLRHVLRGGARESSASAFMHCAPLDRASARATASPCRGNLPNLLPLVHRGARRDRRRRPGRPGADIIAFANEAIICRNRSSALCAPGVPQDVDGEDVGDGNPR